MSASPGEEWVFTIVTTPGRAPRLVVSMGGQAPVEVRARNARLDRFIEEVLAVARAQQQPIEGPDLARGRDQQSCRFFTFTKCATDGTVA